MEVNEKLCLRWDEFQKNASSAFGELRRGREFSDVTLACEDGREVEAHKIILASSSFFFKRLFERQNHPRPFIYMRGVKAEDLEALVDFIYFGETTVMQENLEPFMDVATELNVKGLDFGENQSKENISSNSPFAKAVAVEEIEGGTNTREDSDEAEKRIEEEVSPFEKVLKHEMGELMEEEISTFEKVANHDMGDEGQSHLDELNNKIKSMMILSENRFKSGRKYEKGRICRVCGKEGKISVLMPHIEAKHISGFSYSCQLCSYTTNTRNNLRLHKGKHKDNK